MFASPLEGNAERSSFDAMCRADEFVAPADVYRSASKADATTAREICAMGRQRTRLSIRVKIFRPPSAARRAVRPDENADRQCLQALLRAAATHNNNRFGGRR